MAPEPPRSPSKDLVAWSAVGGIVSLIPALVAAAVLGPGWIAIESDESSPDAITVKDPRSDRGSPVAVSPAASHPRTLGRIAASRDEPEPFDRDTVLLRSRYDRRPMTIDHPGSVSLLQQLADASVANAASNSPAALLETSALEDTFRALDSAARRSGAAPAREAPPPGSDGYADLAARSPGAALPVTGLDGPTIVPEPSTGALTGIGLLVLGLGRRLRVHARGDRRRGDATRSLPGERSATQGRSFPARESRGMLWRRPDRTGSRSPL